MEQQFSHLHVEWHERHDGAALVAVVVVVVLLTNRTREVEADAELVGITEGLSWKSNSTSISVTYLLMGVVDMCLSRNLLATSILFSSTKV